MILLVDANALVWAFIDESALDPGALAAMRDPGNDVLASAATVWEIEVKRVAGRVNAPSDLLEALASSRVDAIPFTADDAVAAAGLPRHHGDPFDRMLVAQAQRLGAVIVSRDAAFDAYGVDRLRA
jgi:PIN domain nuclease of toxin-antitoxin system